MATHAPSAPSLRHQIPRGQQGFALEEKSIRSVVGRYHSAEVVLENYEQFTNAQLAALVKKIGDRCVGICLDIVNSFGALETPPASA